MPGIFQSALQSLWSIEQSLSTRIYNALFGADNTTAFNDFKAQTVTAFDGLETLVEHSTVLSARAISDLAGVLAESEHWSVDNFRYLTNVILPAMELRLRANAQDMAIHYALNAEQYAAGLTAVEAQQRGTGDAHSREQATAQFQAEMNARIEAVDHTRQQLAAAIALEAAQRAAGDDHTRQQMAAAIKALNDQLTAQIDAVLKYAQSIPVTIDQRAAAGYDPTLHARGDLVQKLLDTVAAHDPAVAGLVADLAKWAVDLAGIDDPVLRVAAQLVLKQVVDRLGLDTALQAMLTDLLGGILGGGQPKTLQAIMADIGSRLDALESATAELSPLAPEADDLHEMGTLIFDASLLAYFTAAVADPVATANDTVAVFAPVTDPLLAPVRAMLGM